MKPSNTIIDFSAFGDDHLRFRMADLCEAYGLRSLACDILSSDPDVSDMALDEALDTLDMHIVAENGCVMSDDLYQASEWTEA